MIDVAAPLTNLNLEDNLVAVPEAYCGFEVAQKGRILLQGGAGSKKQLKTVRSLKDIQAKSAPEPRLSLVMDDCNVVPTAAFRSELRQHRSSRARGEW